MVRILLGDSADGVYAASLLTSWWSVSTGTEGYAMVIEVGGMPGGFNIIVALASSLDGPWSL